MENKINAEDLVKNQDIDASHWAAAFMQIFGSDLRQIDEGLMISWFANSIMVTHDKISNEKDAAVEQLKKENERLYQCNLNEAANLFDCKNENAKLKSKLKVAAEALNDLFNKAKDGSHYESIAREALKEIES